MAVAEGEGEGDEGAGEGEGEGEGRSRYSWGLQAGGAGVSTDSDLSFGTKVELFGLVSAPQHNGKIGTIVKGLDPASGRVQVSLEGADGRPGE